MNIELVREFAEELLRMVHTPLYNNLEAGFVHGPLSSKRKLDRYSETFENSIIYLTEIEKFLTERKASGNLLL